jgi:hypothetical protein
MHRKHIVYVEFDTTFQATAKHFRMSPPRQGRTIVYQSISIFRTELVNQFF